MATILITGANKGIGLELTRAYGARGDRVIAACRTTSPELRSLDVDVLEGFEATSAASLTALTDSMDGATLDLLIANAGIRSFETFDDLDLARIRHQIEVNAIAPLALTHALAPKLRPGAKVALISTRAASLADNGSGGEYGYRLSKAALNMAGVNLAHDLRQRGIAVVLLHPGFVHTDLTGGDGVVSAADSAAKLVALIDRLGLPDSGGFFHADGQRLPW